MLAHVGVRVRVHELRRLRRERERSVLDVADGRTRLEEVLRLRLLLLLLLLLHLLLDVQLLLDRPHRPVHPSEVLTRFGLERRTRQRGRPF